MYCACIRLLGLLCATRLVVPLGLWLWGDGNGGSLLSSPSTVIGPLSTLPWSRFLRWRDRT